MNLSFLKSSKSVSEEDPHVEDKEKSSFTSKLGGMGRNISKKMNLSSVLNSTEDSEDHIKSTSRSDGKDKRLQQVMQVMEDFRLQCPQTHAGLVVAFAAKTLSPVFLPDVKFKWYRLGSTSRDEQFLLIDESSRGWYPPTADDIGKRICAQCEDCFDMGYSKYAEAGPLEADPLLVSMVDSAFENGRYEVKETSAVSFGTKLLPMGSSNSSANSALCADDPINPFLSLQQLKISAEVTYSGVLLFDATGASDTIDFDSTSGSSGGRKGFHIDASPALEVSCCLPASLIITVPTSKHFYYTTPLPSNEEATSDHNNAAKPNENQQEKQSIDHKIGTPASGKRKRMKQKDVASDKPSDSNQTEEETSAVAADEKQKEEDSPAEAEIQQEEQESSSDQDEEDGDEEDSNDSGDEDSECSDTTETSVASNLPEPPAHSMGCEWIGDATGELYTQTAHFMSQITGKGIKSYRVCIVCSDRIQRDALVLAIRLLAGFDSSASVRQRLAVLPWYDSGENVVVPVNMSPEKKPERRSSVSMAVGGDVTKRLRELEAENAALRRAKNELTVQLVEQESEGAYSARGNRSNSTAAAGGADEIDANSEQAQALKHKIRELENKISSAHLREIEAEKENMELTNRVKRLSSEIDALGIAGADLQEKLLTANTEASAARTEVEKCRGEIETLKRQLAETANESRYRSTISEQEHAIVDLRRTAAEAESNLADANQRIETLESEVKVAVEKEQQLQEHADEKQKIADKLSSEVQTLQRQIDEMQHLLKAAETEKEELREQARCAEQVTQLQKELAEVTGEKNHWQRKAESLVKDMKRVLREHNEAVTQAQQKYLDKETECEELQARLNQLSPKNEANKDDESSKKKSGGMKFFGRGKKSEDESH